MSSSLPAQNGSPHDCSTSGFPSSLSNRIRRQQKNKPPPPPALSSDHQALSLRGGGNTLKNAAFIPGQEVLTFGQNLAGQVFCFSAVMYGLACSLAPKSSASLFYGFDSKKVSSDGVDRMKFLMRIAGSIACGIGLTASFAIASELKVFGHMPSTQSFHHAIGIGLIPRFALILHALFFNVPPPSSLRIGGTPDLCFCLLDTTCLMLSLLTNRLDPTAFVNFEVFVCLLLGPLVYFKPSLLFKTAAPPFLHEKLVTRLGAAYTVMGGVLLAALQYPAINALPAVGLTALAWVAALMHLTFWRADVEECGSSVLTHIGMIAGGLAVAAGGLRHYLVI